MNMEAGPLGEPVPDQRRLVGGVVVGNQVPGPLKPTPSRENEPARPGPESRFQTEYYPRP